MTFGISPFGIAGMGDDAPPNLALLGALAYAENVIRLQFSVPVYWSGVLDMNDASRPEFYVVSPVGTTIGYDGLPARPVSCIAVEVATDELPDGAIPGQYLDLTLDRPMSPYPAAYQIDVTSLVSADLSQVLEVPASVQCYAVFKQIIQPSISSPTPSRDFSNPQSLATVPQGAVLDPSALGVFAVDSTGDYAYDSGFVSYKKRLYRRLITRPGGFLHLGPNYGVGIPQHSKKLAQASVLAKLAAEAEKQIGQEPETASVKVTTTSDGTGLVRFNIFVRMRNGSAWKFAPTFATQ